jgi:hypothetical protein
VVLIDYQKRQIDLWTRSADCCQSQRYHPGEVVPLPPVHAQLGVDPVFAAAHGA